MPSVWLRPKPCQASPSTCNSAPCHRRSPAVTSRSTVSEEAAWLLRLFGPEYCAGKAGCHWVVSVLMTCTFHHFSVGSANGGLLVTADAEGPLELLTDGSAAGGL